MTTASTIELFFSLINYPRRRPGQRLRVGNACLNLRPGQVIDLPAGRHVHIVSGRTWLTHRGDSRDYFPTSGDSFETTQHSKSVIQALADSTILIQ